MKGRYAAAAMAASGAYAQGPPAYGGGTTSTSGQPVPSISYTTVTYDDCPSMSMETMITVTNGITVTYCPECDMHSQNGKPTPGYTTTYTTTYLSLCPTGLVPKTYTVTESCTEPEPTWTPGPSHIPQGFTVTEKVCTVCDKTPTTVTMTEPCGCEAHEGTPGPPPPVPAKPTGGSGPVTQLPDGQPEAPGPSSGGSGSSSPPCSGDNCVGSANGLTPASGGSGSGSPPSGGSGSGSSSGSPPSGASGSSSPPAGGSSSGSTPCDGADCGGSSSGSSGDSPAPGSGPSGAAAPSATTEACAGPNCRAMVTGSSAPGVNYTTHDSNGMPNPPSEGTQPSNGASVALISTSIMAAVIAALAFAL